MSFTSYAQNFEDVMLWRALGHVEAGVYIDVGAQHPRVDSVSRAFYERGWRGVHVEPVPYYAALLRADRPDETVLECALGEQAGTLELNVIAATGLSTALDQHAERHQAALGVGVERLTVPQRTLDAALPGLDGRQVHWLKIDVEGFEEQVLRGWDSAALRPWIIVVEATVPGSPLTDYAGWDPLLAAARYRFVYFDGLNRFYIAEEQAGLAAAFACPPNVFDGFTLSGEGSWGLCAPALAREAEQARLAAQWRRLADERDATLQAVYASTSWRLTAPLRKAKAIAPALLRRMADRSWRLAAPLRQGIASGPALLRRAARRLLGLPARTVRAALGWTMRRVLASSAMTGAALRFLRRHPRLRAFALRCAARAGVIQRHSAPLPARQAAPRAGSGALSARAEHTLAQLRSAFAAKND